MNKKKEKKEEKKGKKDREQLKRSMKMKKTVNKYVKRKRIILCTTQMYCYLRMVLLVGAKRPQGLPARPSLQAGVAGAE